MFPPKSGQHLPRHPRLPRVPAEGGNTGEAGNQKKKSLPLSSTLTFPLNINRDRCIVCRVFVKGLTAWGQAGHCRLTSSLAASKSLDSRHPRCPRRRRDNTSPRHHSRRPRCPRRSRDNTSPRHPRLPSVPAFGGNTGEAGNQKKKSLPLSSTLTFPLNINRDRCIVCRVFVKGLTAWGQARHCRLTSSLAASKSLDSRHPRCPDFVGATGMARMTGGGGGVPAFFDPGGVLLSSSSSPRHSRHSIHPSHRLG